MALLATTGCMVFEHPLSDPDATVIDERLVGYWQYVPSGAQDKPGPGPLAIGRQTGAMDRGPRGLRPWRRRR